MKSLPDSCKVVLLGGEVVGNSCLYHQAKFSCKDVILLDKDKLTLEIN